MTEINLIWLKRDLRTQDHAAFQAAEQSNIPYFAIYVFEPSLLSYPDCSQRHLQFIYHSLTEMNDELKKYNRKILIFHAEVIDVLQYFSEKFVIKNIFSYQESGIMLTWKRDQLVSKWLEVKKIYWQEFQRDGVIRDIRNRKTWDQKWYTVMHQPVIQNTYSYSDQEVIEHPFKLPSSLELQLQEYPVSFQQAGEKFAWRYLSSFCRDRGKDYHRLISKPTESRKSCGRISPYLAWGNLSVKQVYQFVKNHPNYPLHKRGFSGLLTRLKWRCHFIQKFEVECEYETRCINRGYENMLYENNEHLITAWKEGKTGFPLLDACMRCLIQTGWMNFRMRAMMVSVFCHHFDCDWRKGVYHLAQLFLDYEPGIHYPQFQMQAGTTGVNTVRMYNPVRQSKDHDPEGIFIRKWIPELEKVPNEFIHEPWKITNMEKDFIGIELNYPKPMIQIDQRGKMAREKIWGHRKEELVRKESLRILKLHTRENRRP